eukprot:CAMPEP_0113879052 /NCGR_PEP_ID=MMETSP0780_2-20120614/7022_1 /TAXON_ID=652834 /ORGANISM="Palpitomonas bilix" /LENGTH=510 /DNA_ID=CAMNT_0000865587 /DNA_START=157 /DNA_END=1689 /DNA_ORIENTATION=+ /assembly_acc=CAM_ASM_000599
MDPGRESDMDFANTGDWSIDEVAKWLSTEGFSHLAPTFKEQRIDGDALLLLTENDLRNPPMSLPALGDIKKIGSLCTTLRRATRRQSPPSSPSLRSEDTIVLSSGSNDLYGSRLKRRGRASSRGSPSPPFRPLNEKERDSPPPLPEAGNSPRLFSRTFVIDLIKLAVAGAFLMVVSFVTSMTMTVVHERLPDPSTYPPLPDIVLDNVPHMPWAFQAAELMCIALASIVSIICVFHKHRIVIATRLLAILGAVFLLRCLTMFVTSLSVPGVHLTEPCMEGRQNRTFEEKLQMAWDITRGGGMSLQGVTTCGDYMFSGHTAVLTTLSYTILHYTPSVHSRRLHVSSALGMWQWLHTCVWISLLFGMFFILAAHEHYSVDVVVSYYISSRCFMNYHVRAAAWARQKKYLRSRMGRGQGRRDSISNDHIDDLATTSTMQYHALTDGEDTTTEEFLARERNFRRQVLPMSSFPLFLFFESHRKDLIHNVYEVPFKSLISHVFKKRAEVKESEKRE